MTGTVSELQRAWRAVQAGVFRDPAPLEPIGAADSGRVWCPEPGERVLPVVGAHSGAGATMLALALATASAPSRVVECVGLAVGGLAAAPTAELGDHHGWVQGSRADVIVERLRDTIVDPGRAPFPPLPDRVCHLTVIDVSWDPAILSSTTAWLATLLKTSPSVVVVAAATVPGLRRLEVTVQELGQARCVAAVVGPPRHRRARCLTPGTLTGTLMGSGRLVHVPALPAVRLSGADAGEVPAPLLAAARRILALTTEVSGEDLS